MAKASKKSDSKPIDELDVDIELGEPETVDLDSNLDLDFDVDTGDLEARIAEISDDIMSGTDPVEDKSLPSERLTSSADALNEEASSITQELPLPANDEHNAEINSILYAISNKPRSYAFLIAGLFTIVWLAACAAVGYYTIYDTLPSTLSLESVMANQPLLIFSAGVLISLFVIWSCAILVKRSQDMKYSTNLMLSAAKQLLQPESIAIDSVTSVGTAVRREVAAIGEGVERAIARAGELEFMIQNEVMNIERSYGDSETKLRRLVDEISSERQEIVTHADKLQEAINKTHTNLSSELASAATRIDETVRNTTDLKAKEMSDQVVSAGQVVAKLLETRTASFQKASAAIEEKLDAGKQAFEASLDHKTANLDTILNSAGQSVSTILDSGFAKFSEKSSELVGTIDVVQQKMVDEFVRQGDATTQNLEDSLSIRAEEFSSRISESGNIIHTNISDKLAKIDSSMTTVGEKLVSSLGMRAEELDKLLNDKSSQIGNTLNSSLSVFDQKLTENVSASVDKLQATSADLLDNAQKAEEIISIRSKSIEDTIKNSTIDFVAKVGENISTIETHTEDMQSKLSNATEQVSQTVISGSKGLSELLADQNDKIAVTVSEGKNLLSETMISGVQQLGDIMASGNDGINADFKAQTTAMKEQLDTEKQEIQNILKNSTFSFDNAISSLKQTSEDSANTIKDIVSQNADTLSDTINNSVSAVERQFTAGTQILETNLDKGKTELLGTISKAVAESSKVFDDKSDSLSSIMAERIGEVSSKLDYKTAQFNKLLSERASELSNIIENKASPIAENLESATNDISARLTNIAETVSNNTTELFSNVGQTTGALEQLSNEATSNLTYMRSELLEHIKQFSDLMRQSQDEMSTSTALSENIYSKLQASSSGMLHNIQEIADRVEAQGNNLKEATRLIDHTQTNFESTIDAKQASLHELSSKIAHRSDELHSTIESFGTVINSLVDQVGETSRNLTGTVSSDISSTIEAATVKFDETLHSMQNAAHQMRVELDQTREEMRRGVLELPEETAQSADAMRRVVTDQISALKDLTKIIEDSGEILDAKTPKPVSKTPASTSNTRSMPEPRRAPLPKATPPVRPNVAPSVIPESSGSAFSPFEPAVRNKPAPAAPSWQSTQTRPSPEPNTDSDAGNGWVSDLLRRASQEPDKATYSSKASPSLKNLSEDIPNAIDDHVISDLWARYRNGENNLFTRDIYNFTGKTVFDQILQNYMTNSEFKSGIDGYIADFENRLTQAGKQGQSDQAIHSYLISDQGKIYTMLAHAAGRYK